MKIIFLFKLSLDSFNWRGNNRRILVGGEKCQDVSSGFGPSFPFQARHAKKIRYSSVTWHLNKHNWCVRQTIHFALRKPAPLGQVVLS